MKAEVYALYPEATDTFRYTVWDLEALVSEQAQREMQSIEDLHAFYWKFIVISTFLVKRNRLASLEQARWFLGAYSGNQASHLPQRLKLKYPDAHTNNIPDLVDVFEEAQFVLRQHLFSAGGTGNCTRSTSPSKKEKCDDCAGTKCSADHNGTLYTYNFLSETGARGSTFDG